MKTYVIEVEDRVEATRVYVRKAEIYVQANSQEEAEELVASGEFSRTMIEDLDEDAPYEGVFIHSVEEDDDYNEGPNDEMDLYDLDEYDLDVSVMGDAVVYSPAMQVDKVVPLRGVRRIGSKQKVLFYNAVRRLMERHNIDFVWGYNGQ